MVAAMGCGDDGAVSYACEVILAIDGTASEWECIETDESTCDALNDEEPAAPNADFMTTFHAGSSCPDVGYPQSCGVAFHSNEDCDSTVPPQ